MIKALQKIIVSEINKSKKKNLYRKVVTIDNSKIKTVVVGKLSY